MEKVGLKKLTLVNANVYSKLKDITNDEIDEGVIDTYAEKTVKYYNGAGYDSKDGKPTTRETGKFLCIDTPYKTINGEEICGWAISYETRKGEKGYRDLNWGTKTEFGSFLNKNKITKSISTFSIGRIYFYSKDDANKFLEDLKNFIIEEDWTFGLSTSTFQYPILKSYIEHTLDRLIYEYELGNHKKLAFSKDQKYIAFNTNLLSRSYYNDVIVIGQVDGTDVKSMRITDPHVVTGGNHTYTKYGFQVTKEWQYIENIIVPPCYFSNINEVIFNAVDSYVDLSNERNLDHIIKERRNRWPDKYQCSRDSFLAQELKKAIDHAMKMARRNYKYIVPMYFPEQKKLQFLMPLFYDENTTKPGQVIILDKDCSGQFYTPITAITFESAYMDARLIVKPESSWLNPSYDKD